MYTAAASKAGVFRFSPGSLSDAERGIASVHTLSASGTAPTAVEFVEKDVVRLGEEFTGEKFPPCDAACYLILTFDGSRTGVEEGP